MMIGGRDRDVHISLYRESGDIADVIDNILDIHVLGVERVKSGAFEQHPARVRGLLVYDIADNPLVHNGRFYVLLGEGDTARRGGDAAYLHMMSIAVICFYINLKIS